MSVFDEERKKLGLPTSTDKQTSGSAFDGDRMDLGLIKDTRPKPEDKTKEIPKTQAEANVSTKVSDTLKGKIPAAQLVTTPNAFGNDAITNFSGKVPAANMIMASTGGPDNASKIPGIAHNEYEVEQQRIDASKAPEIVKSGATVLNKLGRDTTVGKFLTNLFPTDTQAVQRDSTGNKTLDKIDNFAAAYLTPAMIPTGAPYGQGIVGSTYESAGKALSKGVGQSAVNTLAKAVPFAGKDAAQNIARVGLTEGLAGAAQGAGFGVQQGQDTGKEIARNATFGAAGGFVLGSGGAALGEAFPAIASRFKKTPTEAPANEVPVNTAPESIPMTDPVQARITPNPVKEPASQIAEPTFAEVPAQPVNKAAEAPIPARDPNVPVTREQALYDKDIKDWTPEDIAFSMSPEFNNANIVETPRFTVKADEVAPTVKEPVPAPKAQRGFTETLKESPKTPEPLKAKLNSEYEPITNADTVAKANERIARDVEDETRRIMNTDKYDAEDSVVAQRLIDHYNKQGNYKASVDIADKIATQATKAGQFIQSLSIYNRLTPEGVLIHAKRIAKRINETSSKLSKPAEVTPKMAEDIVSLAGVTQKMTGVKDLSSNVIDILERAKGGAKLSADEANTLERFVNESKQFIKESTEKVKKRTATPRQNSDKRVRDNLKSFFDEQEAAARERLKARGNRLSATPLDVWADYAVIGAAKIAKGTIRFADWSEQMVKDFGSDIKPQLEQLYERSKEAFNITSKKITRQTISEAEKLTQKVIKDKELTGVEAESLLNMAQRVSALSGEAKRVASQDLQTILQSMDKPSFLRKVASAQTQAQLLNPKTQVRNVLGNELFYRLERINKYVSTPIDIARSKLTGSDRTVTFRTFNQGKYWDNWIKGGSAGARGVNINGLETQFDLASPAFRGKYNPLKYTEKALGASLRSFDNAAYSRAVNKSLGEMATLDAINKGVKPSKEYVQNFVAKTDENVRQIADDYGRYVTFQDNNIISQGLTKFKRGLNLGKDFGLGDLVLKYPKTPGALLMRALEYSPAGFIRSGMQIARPIFKNGIKKDPAAVVQGLSRAIVGTFGLSALGYYLIDNDIITGQASKDPDVRALQTAAGKGAYQVNLSALERFVTSGFDKKAGKIKEGDLLYTYDWMQPVSIAISLGANTNKALSGEGPKNNVATGIAGGVYDAVSGSVNTLTEQSVLQGLQRAAEGYPGQTAMDKIADILSDIPASFIPTIFNQVKQLSDNTKRETTDPTLLEKSLNKAQAKIPFFAGKLPKKYDTLGNEQKHYQNSDVGDIFLNPGFATRYKLSDEARMIVDLIAETGDESVAPRVPNKKVNGLPLTGEEFSRLSQLQGEFTNKSLGKVKESLSDKSKIKSINKKLTDSGSKAKKELLKEYPRLQAKP
ncbi:hypothetical protein A3842_11255 [Paenibacillus sp. P3E]|uniref:hypothetical protein n=1 Tax=Paenibacillus sp. P3E TaxID=1349435 RepID=UPI00093C41A4|nr:hypothetical protein [Paenibacillus sp. P3E]OKP81648.1 hypothetical protein A3842_11255 [Paenibacillus sp. P3E]